MARKINKKEVIEEIEEDIDDEIEEVKDDIKITKKPIKNTMSDKTRYIIIGVVSILLMVLIVVIAIFGENKSTASVTKTTEERNTSTDNLKEFYEAFDSKTTKVIFFARSTCGYCVLQKPILEEVAKEYDLDYYAIDTDKLTQSEANEIISALGIQGSTPTTVIVKEGKVINKVEGYLDGKPYVEFLANNGAIDKNAVYKAEEKLVSITYSDFKDITKKDKYSLVLLDTSACEGCITVRSILNELASENDFTVNYLGATTLSESDIKSLVEKDLKNLKYSEKAYTEEGQVEVPLLLVIKDNKIRDYVLKSTDKSDYTKILKKYDFIK